VPGRRVLKWNVANEQDDWMKGASKGGGVSGGLLYSILCDD